MAAAFRSIISFVWKFYVGEWITSAGPAEPFGFGMLIGLFSFTIAPLYIWDKRMRIATAAWLPKESTH